MHTTQTNALPNGFKFTVKQTMAIFEVCDSTLRNWRKAGLLVPEKIGGRVLYSRTAIISLMGRLGDIGTEAYA